MSRVANKQWGQKKKKIRASRKWRKAENVGDGLEHLKGTGKNKRQQQKE